MTLSRYRQSGQGKQKSNEPATFAARMSSIRRCCRRLPSGHPSFRSSEDLAPCRPAQCLSNHPYCILILSLSLSLSLDRFPSFSRYSKIMLFTARVIIWISLFSCYNFDVQSHINIRCGDVRIIWTGAIVMCCWNVSKIFLEITNC